MKFHYAPDGTPGEAAVAVCGKKVRNWYLYQRHFLATGRTDRCATCWKRIKSPSISDYEEELYEGGNSR